MSAQGRVLASAALALGLMAAAWAQETVPPSEPPVAPADTAPGETSPPEAAPAAAAPATPALPDTSGWTCRFCTFESGSRGWLEPAAGYVSEDSFRFGDYTGLEDEGPFLDLSGAWRYRDADDADFFDSYIRHYGLDARGLGVRGGRQGRYDVGLEQQSIPHRVAGDARTPFVLAGVLDLPAGWTRGSSTAAMTDLDASLHPVWLRQDRERTVLRGGFLPARSTQLRASYRHEDIRGTGSIGGSFLTRASQLPRPVDQTLDQVDLAASYQGDRGHGQVAWMSSFFGNDAQALAWENPYTGPAPGSDYGQLAQAPDNRAHRLSLTLGLPPTLPLQLTGHVALGRLEQDERFLPATVNPDEAVALPRASLDGEVDTMLASVRASLPLTRGLRLSADVLHDERDNNTPTAAYTQVVMDSFTGAMRTNTPFSFSRDRWRLSVEKRTGLRVGVGLEQDSRERTLGTRRDTDETTTWARLGWRPLPGSDLRVRYAHAQRDGAETAAVPGAPSQNPLMRTLESAERRRNEVRADLGLGWTIVSGAFNVSYARNAYPETQVGRTADTGFGYGTDWTVQPVETLTMSAFVSRHRNETEQAGSEAFAQPDWFAEQDDTTTVAGLHAAWQAPRKLELGADYVYTASDGTLLVMAAANDYGFPALVTRWHDLRVYARYPLRPALALRLDLLYEDYDADDWSLDAVGPDTAAGLLALGQGTQDGTVLATVLSLRYDFAGATPAAAED